MELDGLFYFQGDVQYPVCIGVGASHYATGKTKDGFYENELRGRNHAVRWGNAPFVELLEEGVTIRAYPSPDFKFIVAVYDYNSRQFPPPNNAVVYAIDGTIHKVISTPLLGRPDTSGSFQKAYGFNNVGWKRNNEGQLALCLWIREKDSSFNDWMEERLFTAETGELGEVIMRFRH
jgi:hypothetical protein